MALFSALLLAVVSFFTVDAADGSPSHLPGSETCCKDPKLSAILIGLVRAVEQKPGAAVQDLAALQEALSAGKLPKAIRDAILSHQMRINDDTKGQVYMAGEE